MGINPFQVTGTYIEARYYDPIVNQTQSKHFHRGTIQSVRRELTGAGHTVLDLTERSHRRINNQFYAATERSNFLRTLAAFIRAGIPPTDAVRSTVGMIQHRSKRAELQPALDVLDGGGTLSDSLERIPLLDPVAKSFFAAAVAANAVQQIVEPLLAYRASLTTIWRSISTGLAIAGFELVMAIASVASMEVGGFDWIASEMGGSNPDFASKVELARLLNRCLLIVGLAPFVYAGVIFVLSRLTDPGSRRLVGLAISHTPIVRRLFSHLAVAETFSIAGFMLRAGAPFLVACNSALSATNHPLTRAYWHQVLTLHRERGEPVTAAIASAKGPLTPWEQMPLVGHSGTRHSDLAETMQAIAADRVHAASVEAGRLTRRISLVILAYLGASIGLFLYLVLAQNEMTDGLFQGAF
ncbi:type II secretion system F family protein [Thalassobaculum litoreum]|uniref:Type II secretory pathway, component PulF n=1 Tax=Thalassobaculum litoreum DSM 18839 TaxID=1123362 RepID=A0A8G2BMW9_9PROT|nr:type II secretion system F family protein [Thalassobaculum litoreum]SDG53636.1 Type II secretory pathway, component PulF [Thalassobaculum litoreum DSM 18839]